MRTSLKRLNDVEEPARGVGGGNVSYNHVSTILFWWRQSRRLNSLLLFSLFVLICFKRGRGLGGEMGLNMKYSPAPHLSGILLFPFFTPQSSEPASSFFT